MHAAFQLLLDLFDEPKPSPLPMQTQPVPTIVVAGQNMTSPAQAKGEERTTQVVEFLAAKARGR